MKEKTKVIGLQIENVKRINAVDLGFEDGLTIIGGKNRQGKTSIIDTMMSLIGGEKCTPTNAVHDGKPKGKAKLTLSNGVEISANYTENGRTKLKVHGVGLAKSPQAAIKQIFGDKALDVSKFLKAKDKEKAETLLRIIGLNVQPFEAEQKKLFDERTLVNREVKKQELFLEEMETFEEYGKELKSISDLIEKQQKMIKNNQENAEKRQFHTDNCRKYEDLCAKQDGLNMKINAMKEELNKLEEHAKILVVENTQMLSKIELEKIEVAKLVDEDHSPIVSEMETVEQDNIKIQANINREKAEDELKSLEIKSKDLTIKLETSRQALKDLLNNADMPLSGMSVENGQITLNGKAWDCMATSEQFLVAAAVQAKLTPDAPILLIDGLESLDKDSIDSLSDFADERDLQIIGTMVTSNDDDADYIICDGMVKE